MKQYREIKNLKLFTLMLLSSLLFCACKDTNTKPEKVETEDFSEVLLKAQKQKLGKYSLRSGGDNENLKTFQDSLSDALSLSVKGNYRGSKDLLLALSQSDPNNEEVILQIVIQDFNMGNYTKATERLNQILKSSNKDIRSEAEIIMANVSLSFDDNNSTAIKWMKKITADKTHPYYKIAKGQLSLYE